MSKPEVVRGDQTWLLVFCVYFMLQDARASEEHCKLPQWGMGQSPAERIWGISASFSKTLLTSLLFFRELAQSTCHLSFAEADLGIPDPIPIHEL